MNCRYVLEKRIALALRKLRGETLTVREELEDEAERRRVAREDRLRALGFEEPTAEQRKENLALNVALREWPKD